MKVNADGYGHWRRGKETEQSRSTPAKSEQQTEAGHLLMFRASDLNANEGIGGSAFTIKVDCRNAYAKSDSGPHAYID